MRFLLRLFVLIVLTAASSFAQDQNSNLRVDVQVISVGVEVFDPLGRPVVDLNREDFSVYEDRQIQTIRNFAAADLPYNLVFLFDCSESTQSQWPLLKDAVAQFSQYKRPDDRVLLAAFGSKVQVIQDWNAEGDWTFERDERVCSGTHLHEALDWAAQRLRSVRTRRGIVVLTDGVDSADDSVVAEDFQRTLRAFQENGIPIYFVAIGTDLNPTLGVVARPIEVRQRMELLAEASGGRVAFPKKREDVSSMYEEIGQALRASYSLGYAPPKPIPDGKRHRIEVRLQDAKLNLRQSRDEYVWK